MLLFLIRYNFFLSLWRIREKFFVIIFDENREYSRLDSFFLQLTDKNKVLVEYFLHQVFEMLFLSSTYSYLQ